MKQRNTFRLRVLVLCSGVAAAVAAVVLGLPHATQAALITAGDKPQQLLIGLDDDNTRQYRDSGGRGREPVLNRTDVLVGGPSNDVMFGLNGNDVMDGGRGRDIILGGPDGGAAPGGPPNSDIMFGGPRRRRQSVGAR